MSSENVKVESENVGKSILSPQNRNRTLLLKKTVKDEEVEGSDTGDTSPMIKVTPAKSMSKLQVTSKKGDVLSKSVIKGEISKAGLKKDSTVGKKTIVDITSSGLLGLSGRLREKKQSVPLNLLKGTTNLEGGKVDIHKSIKSPSNLQGSVLPGTKNMQNFTKIMNLVNKINVTKDLSSNIEDLDPLRSKFIKTNKNNINNRSHLFGHEPVTYTTNPLVIEDLIDELEEKAKNYFIMFSKERKEREKLERQCYWMQEENKTLQNTLKNQITTIQGLQNKIIDLRGNPNVITETIERIDMLYTQLDTLIQAFAGICSYITFNEPTDRREIIELVLEYLHPCRGLDLRLNSLYGSIYYFKLGIIKDLPPPIQPPEKIPGYDVWQPPPPQKVDTKDSDNSKLEPHMQQGNSLSKVADNYLDGVEAGAIKASVSDKTNKDDQAIPKISTPVASTKQSFVPTSSSQLTGDVNIPLSGFEIKIKSVQAIEPIGDGKGKLYFVARIDNESSLQCKNNPKRKSSEFEYKINPTNNKGSINDEIDLQIDALPPKSPGLIPRFTIDMWESSITSGPLGYASKTFIDPYTLLPEQPWEVLKEEGDKPLATLIITVTPKPGNSMLPAGRFIVAKESKNKQDQAAKKESKLSRLSFRGDKESKGLDKINSMLRPALNIGKRTKSASNLDGKDEKIERLKEVTDLTKSVVKPLSVKESTSVPPPVPTHATVTSKSEAQESSSAPKSPQIIVKELPKASVSEPDTSTLKKSIVAEQPPKADLKSSIKALPGPEPSPEPSPGIEKVEEAKPKSSEPIIKENISKSNLLAPKSDLIKSETLKKSMELGKSQVDSKSMTLKKTGSGDLGASNKPVSAPKADAKSSISGEPESKESKASTPVKILPKIAPKPAITKDQATNNAPKAVQANNLVPGKPGQIAPPTIIKKIDVKPAAIKPKIATAAPAINIKKPGSPIQIKPKGIELGKPTVTITPKFAANPPKTALGGAAGNGPAQPKEDLKIVVTKGAVNISPKIVPKVKIMPKVKI
ncbi:uncharacterized protein ELE39_002995 [Cryptosporidium sp. chipmunk genotype I]|uniref:uncharacterized protein n=1 Tax=Cryptosporidium sp. chipmunk genotype I TaxID=1280935 RepID=UPI003519F4B3|nr:hypothetical protein ELE39_002995 [Cryptosporidium sp. chipmunk genotype I]